MGLNKSVGNLALSEKPTLSARDHKASPIPIAYLAAAASNYNCNYNFKTSASNIPEQANNVV